MATPSSKHNPGATPTHLGSSPRPSSTPMARHLSHKSPSARTPSVSGGHGNTTAAAATTTTTSTHNPSVSSHHQYATPLAAPTATTTAIDDPVTLNSPSALLALGGYSGISPSPAAHDGFGGAGMHENDIHALGMQGLKLGAASSTTARDSDEERRRHIAEVVQILRSRVSGRGVCREGIERLGRLEGFESIWQEDSLSIAGNLVDLEIDFFPGEENVRDVSLRYATPEAIEGEQREEATGVLKSQLIQSPERRERGIWKPLGRFHDSLRWLAKLDKLSQEVNCFEAIESLYASLTRIWDEEGKDTRFSGDYDHLCGGWIGRPCLHKAGRIGFGLDYWVDQARVLDAKRKRVANSDAMAIDQPSEQVSNEDREHQHSTWSIMVECEEGYPSLRVSKDWVNSEVLTSIQPSSPPLNETTKPDAKLVNWADPPPTLTSVNESQHHPMGLDSSMLGPHAPNRRFVAKLDPPLNVPVLVASDIYRLLGIQLPHEMKMVTYDGLLVPGWSPLSLAENAGFGSEETAQPSRKTRAPVQTVDVNGELAIKNHRYSFQAFESVAGRTLHDIPFSHPRQLSDVIPILRQYAVLANLVQRIFNRPDEKGTSRESSKTKASNDSSDSKAAKSEPHTKKNGLVVLSNDDPKEDKLNTLLNNTQHDEQTTTNGDIHVDITLRTQLGQAPVIMLLFSTSRNAVFNLETPGLEIASVSFEIGPNGSISIVDASGLWDEEIAPSSAETAAAENGMDEARRDEVVERQKKMARVLEISQDLGVFVEWVLRWLEQQKRRNG